MAERISDESRLLIAEYYKKGLSHAKIALQIGASPTGVANIIHQMIASGELVEREKNKQKPYAKVPKERVKELYAQGFSVMRISEDVHSSHNTIKLLISDMKATGELHDYVPPEGTVCCSAAISSKCIYGRENKITVDKCRYILCTKKRRGCRWNECNKFEQVTKDNPRRKCVI